MRTGVRSSECQSKEWTVSLSFVTCLHHQARKIPLRRSSSLVGRWIVVGDDDDGSSVRRGKRINLVLHMYPPWYRVSILFGKPQKRYLPYQGTCLRRRRVVWEYCSTNNDTSELVVESYNIIIPLLFSSSSSDLTSDHLRSKSVEYWSYQIMVILCLESLWILFGWFSMLWSVIPLLISHFCELTTSFLHWTFWREESVIQKWRRIRCKIWHDRKRWGSLSEKLYDSFIPLQKFFVFPWHTCLLIASYRACLKFICQTKGQTYIISSDHLRIKHYSFIARTSGSS